MDLQSELWVRSNDISIVCTCQYSVCMRVYVCMYVCVQITFPPYLNFWIFKGLVLLPPLYTISSNLQVTILYYQWLQFEHWHIFKLRLSWLFFNSCTENVAIQTMGMSYLCFIKKNVLLKITANEFCPVCNLGHCTDYLRSSPVFLSCGFNTE